MNKMRDVVSLVCAAAYIEQTDNHTPELTVSNDASCGQDIPNYTLFLRVTLLGRIRPSFYVVANLHYLTYIFL